MSSDRSAQLRPRLEPELPWLEPASGSCAAAALLPMVSLLALAAPKEDKVTQKDLDRITEGYKGLKYLVANWDKETRDCKGVAGGDAQQSVEGVTAGSGFVDGCAASPLIIRNYLGCSNIFHPLFQSEKLWVRIMNSDYLPADSDDFIDAWEEFEKHKRTGDEWAYTSSWGEANPGGGKDKVEDYLLRSKKEVKLATESLGKLIKMLKLA